MTEKIDWRSMFKSVLVRMREAGESNEMGARWMAAEAASAVYSALAAKDADIARLREALESLISAAEEFHEAATAHLSDTTFDRDGILAAREAELTVAALPDARAALAGGSDASTAPSSTTGEAA